MGLTDVEGAFRLLNYSAESAMLFCSTIVEDSNNIENTTIQISNTGTMGATGTCGLYEVIARPLLR